ncbi:uncharacterized protein ARMOST_14150 [Armillaria ostoyae]|uniref:Uncharacterized protein n=1 Tax=Armillaria ostoyae TaxID=47428 RepID=A0A284RPQ8_ARMOS|nr:uncharacterized protein ARMOST_14150 [Armillaria ostoyae]
MQLYCYKFAKSRCERVDGVSSSPPLPPIKTLTPVPDDDDGDEIIKYEYFIRFDPAAYYRPYREVLKLLMPYWHNKSEYLPEEVSDLVKQAYNHLAPGIAQLENENLIDLRVGAAIHHWLTIIHDAQPRRFRIADWHTTVAQSAPEVHPSHFLPRLSPNTPLPGEEGFDMDEPPITLESYLLQRTIFSGTRLRPGALANNTNFPGHVFDCFPTPLPDSDEAEEVIIFSDPPAKKAPPATPAHPTASSSTSAPPVPPRSTRPQRTPMSLIPPVVTSSGVSPSPRNHPRVHALVTVLSQPNSPPSPLANRRAPPLWNSFSPVRPLGLSCHPPSGTTPTTLPMCPALVTPDQMIHHGFQEMASAFQGLCQALLSPGASALVSGSGAAGIAAPAITTSKQFLLLGLASSLTPGFVFSAAPPPPGNAEPPVDNLDLVESSPHSTRRRLKRALSHHNVPPLPPVTGQGAFLGARPLSPIREEAPAPTTPPPPLPVEERLSIVVEQSPPPVDLMDVDTPPSPPRAYHPMTGAPLHSRSLVVMSPAPNEPSLLPESSKAPPPKRGNQGKSKGTKGKAKGKGKAEPARSPTLPPVPPTSAARDEPPLPKKNLKRKRPATQAAASEAGPSIVASGSRPTRTRSAMAKAARIPDTQTDDESAKAGPSVKKPRFSPEKAAKPKSFKLPTTVAPDPAPQDSNQMFRGRPKQQFLAAELTQAQDPEVAGIPIDRHNSRPELENYHFEDLITMPDEFFDPVRYGHKNGTYGARSSRYAFYARAPDHYEKVCLPCSTRMIECTWNNWFPGADCDQCRERHHGGCSARYTACKMHEITSRLTTFAWYNIPSLRRNIMQLHSINRELEHVDYLYRGQVRARDHVVHDITKTLDQFASAEGGNELIEALSGAYHEVRSFIVNDGLRRSVGQPLNLPWGPEYIPSDNNALMWNGSTDDESEDDEGEDADEQAAGPSGTQGGDSSGTAGSSK